MKEKELFFIFVIIVIIYILFPNKINNFFKKINRGIFKLIKDNIIIPFKVLAKI